MAPASLPCVKHGRALFAARRHRPSRLLQNICEAAPCGLSAGRRRALRGLQVRAAHAHGPSAKLAEPGAASAAATFATSSVFSYLGLGSRNSDTIDADHRDGNPDAGAADGGSAAGRRALGIGAGKALLRGLKTAGERLGNSLEQLFFDGAAESMPGWDPSQMAGVLMALGLAHRRPDEAWLNEFWSVSLTKLRGCTTGDLAMLSLGLSELRLQPPQAWRETMLEVTMALAEAQQQQHPLVESEEGSANAHPDPASAAAAGGLAITGSSAGGDGARLGGHPVAALTAQFQDALRRIAPGLATHLGGLLGATDAAHAGQRPAGQCSQTGTGQAASNSQPQPPQPPTLAAWLPANAANRTIAPGSRDALLAAPRPVNSAYDMDDAVYDSSEANSIYNGNSSSGVAGVMLEPVQVAWGGVRRAAAAVSAAWRHSRSSSELVTVVYNLTAAELHLDREWLGRFVQAMQPRLGDLSGDDLHCLLLMLAEEAGGRGGGERAAGFELPPPWQAALYARMDGINWALQGHLLVGCLTSIASIGLRPPPPWVRRQLLKLQLTLPMLPAESLVQLGALLPVLPLHDVPPAAAAAETPTPAAMMAGPAAEQQPGPVGAPRAAVRGLLGPAAWLQPGSMDRWLVEYRAAAAERRKDMEPAELLTVITGVAAAMAAGAAAGALTASPAGVAATSTGPALVAAGPAGPAGAAAAVAAWRTVAGGTGMGSSGSSGSGGSGSVAGEMSYGEWRRAMVDSVAERLPGATFAALCEAWQVLAEAEGRLRLQAAAQPPAAAVTPAAAAEAGQGQGGQVKAEATVTSSSSSSSLSTSSSLSAAAAAAAGAVSGAEQDFEELQKLVAARLAVHPAEQQLATSDVAAVLSSLAAAGLPLPGSTLDALLACTQPLLPGLTSSELVTVALSLVRLSYKPNLAWQGAFCAASRRRLALMTPGQRCSLLVAAASLGLHVPDPWVKDFFAASERGMDEQLDATQLANMLWAASCVVSEPPVAWLERWEAASMPRLRELGPNMLAVVLKAMSTMLYRPSLAWQSAFFGALQRRLFAAGAAQLTWPVPESESDSGAESGYDSDAGPGAWPAAAASQATAVSASAQGPESAAAPGAPTSGDAVQIPSSPAPPASPTTPLASASSPSTSSAASSSSSSGTGSSRTPRGPPRRSRPRPGARLGPSDMLSASVTPEALNSLVYSLASLDLTPPAAWLDELMDAVRCKLSLLSTLDMSVVLAYLVAKGHRPSDEWWESFLESFESRFDSLSANEMSSLLIMLNALRVSPAAQWLDAFCAATEARLEYFQPSQLLQVLSCLHLFRHRPGQAWMGAFTAAVEGQLPRFTPTELARVLMLLDHLNQRPSAPFMLRFYDYSRPGLAQLDPQELVNVAWAVVSCATLSPDVRWTEALVAAARPRVTTLQQPQLRVLVAALGHMQRSTPSGSADNFLALAREFLVV